MKQHGYTLLETLVVIAIIAILFPALFVMIRSLYSSHEGTLARGIALSTGNKALYETLTDIRSASYSESGALPIVSIATSSIVLYTDTDFDRVAERVRYSLIGTSIEKGVIEPDDSAAYPLGDETTSTLLRRVQNNSTGIATFRFFDETSNEIDPATGSTLSVKRITVELGVQGVFGGTETLNTLRGSASIRNLKYIY